MPIRCQGLQPSAQAEARETIPLLKDFHTLWQQMTLTERRAILHFTHPDMTNSYQSIKNGSSDLSSEEPGYEETL